MYLDLKRYVWSSMDEKVKVTGVKMPPFKPKNKYDDGGRVKQIEVGGIYWRKANAIHKWFVDNVQEGKDDCQEHEVSEEKLKELLETIRKVLAASKLIEGKVENGYSFDDKGNRVPIIEEGKLIEDSSAAAELLPTASGFFFGGTGYDEWYYKDLKRTEEKLAEIIKFLESEDGSRWYACYTSSW